MNHNGMDTIVKLQMEETIIKRFLIRLFSLDQIGSGQAVAEPIYF